MANASQQRPTTIAARIRAVMRQLHLTQHALATAAGMAPSQLSVILKRLDARPFAIELETVGRLASAAGVRAMWLLHGEGDPFGGDESQPTRRYPMLREYPSWEPLIAALQHAGYLHDERLVNWVGDCSIPFESSMELSANVVTALARIRLELDYGVPLGAPERRFEAASPPRPRTATRKAKPAASRAKPKRRS